MFLPVINVLMCVVWFTCIALNIFDAGDGQFGEKSVGDIAGEYMEAGRQNLHKFRPPIISFLFFDGITESVSGWLTVA